jgi:antitoxin HigA-1
MGKEKRLPNIHPREVLREDFLKPLGLSQYRLAVDTGIPHSHVTDIVKGRRPITMDTALRLGRYFGVNPQN